MSEPLSAGLHSLVRAADALLGEDRGPGPDERDDDVAGELERALRDALLDQALLPEAMTSSVPRDGLGKYLLHACGDYVVFVTVTAPDVAAPIHDHGSWGLVGLYRGAEEEVRYRFEATAGETPGNLREVERVAYTTGDVMAVQPPPNDIHQVFNRGGRNSVAVNVFRRDLVTSGFRLYGPPDYVARHTGPLTYDRLPLGRSMSAR